MARVRSNVKSKVKPRSTATAEASTLTTFPFVHIGHGTSRCTDDFAIWLLFADVPGAAKRAAIEKGIPTTLQEPATLKWTGPLLEVHSGPDFKYSVAGYDDNYLSWLDDKLGEPLSDTDIARMEREVMNADLSGPRNPSRTVWDAFNADIELWLAAAAAAHPLRLVVKDVTVREADRTAWHDWSAEQALTRFADLPALVRTSRTTSKGGNTFGFVHPLLAAALRATPAKTLTPAQRDLCIDLLDLGGLVTEPGLLAEVVTAAPAKQRIDVVQSLLCAHHGSVMGLFLAGPTRQLLLDDAVFATAIEHAPHCVVPFWRWLDPRDAFYRFLKKRDDATKTWALRVLAIIEANGRLAQEARDEEASGTTAIHLRLKQQALESLRRELQG